MEYSRSNYSIIPFLKRGYQFQFHREYNRWEPWSELTWISCGNRNSDCINLTYQTHNRRVARWTGESRLYRLYRSTVGTLDSDYRYNRHGLLILHCPDRWSDTESRPTIAAGTPFIRVSPPQLSGHPADGNMYDTMHHNVYWLHMGNDV